MSYPPYRGTPPLLAWHGRLLALVPTGLPTHTPGGCDGWHNLQVGRQAAPPEAGYPLLVQHLGHAVQRPPVLLGEPRPPLHLQPPHDLRGEGAGRQDGRQPVKQAVKALAQVDSARWEAQGNALASEVSQWCKPRVSLGAKGMSRRGGNPRAQPLADGNDCLTRGSLVRLPLAGVARLSLTAMVPERL